MDAQTVHVQTQGGGGGRLAWCSTGSGLRSVRRPTVQQGCWLVGLGWGETGSSVPHADDARRNGDTTEQLGRQVCHAWDPCHVSTWLVSRGLESDRDRKCSRSHDASRKPIIWRPRLLSQSEGAALETWNRLQYEDGNGINSEKKGRKDEKWRRWVGEHKATFFLNKMEMYCSYLAFFELYNTFQGIILSWCFSNQFPLILSTQIQLHILTLHIDTVLS